MLKNGRIIGTQLDPNVYHERTESRGHKDFVMSKSELFNFASNAHRWVNGYKDGETEDTKSTLWGQLIDCLLLDPERFDECFVVAPETYMAEGKKKGDPEIEKPWNNNATVCKEWDEAQGGKTVIKADLKKEADTAIKQLKTDPIINAYVACSEKQVGIMAEWHDRETGLVVPVKGLIDLVPDKTDKLNGQTLGDLKTLTDASQDAWEVQVFKYGYHIQAALYLALYNLATGENRADFVFPLSENKHPYETARRMLTTEYLEMGELAYQSALQKYCQCLKSDIWPGYDETDGVSRISVNGWTLSAPKAWMIAK